MLELVVCFWERMDERFEMVAFRDELRLDEVDGDVEVLDVVECEYDMMYRSECTIEGDGIRPLLLSLLFLVACVPLKQFSRV